MKILTAAQQKELDRYTIGHEPIRPIDLMERAAAAITQELVRRWNTNTPMVIVAGPGNNGGDALAVGRMLHLLGYQVRMILVSAKGTLSEDCRTNLERYRALPGADLTEVRHELPVLQVQRKDVVVDGLFGTGLSRPLEGIYADAVRLINRLNGIKVSIDMPSGLMAEDNRNNPLEGMVKADLTLTLHAPKLSFFFAEHHEVTGQVTTVDIRLHPKGSKEMVCRIQTTEADNIRPLLKERPPYAHKGSMGHALLVAGQYGMAGAALLAGRACMRSGSGKLTILSAAHNNDLLQTGLPEAILLQETCEKHITTLTDTAPYQGIAIGPGIGTHEATAHALHGYLLQGRKMVLDADALNLLAMHPEWMCLIPKGSILTPHPKELERLTAPCHSHQERLEKALELARENEVYVILKGHHSMICTPQGDVYINTTGNAGMATAGSGDVLTGMLGALMARGYNSLDAALTGTYLHGLAGDIGVRRTGEESLMASDLVESLPEAFKQLKGTI